MESCILATLKTTSDAQCQSVAIPAISSGIFEYPKRECADVLFGAVERFAKDHKNEKQSLQVVRFTNIDNDTVAVFRDEFKRRYLNI